MSAHLRPGLTRPKRDPRSKVIEKFLDARREAVGSPTMTTPCACGTLTKPGEARCAACELFACDKIIIGIDLSGAPVIKSRLAALAAGHGLSPAEAMREMINAELMRMEELAG